MRVLGCPTPRARGGSSEAARALGDSRRRYLVIARMVQIYAQLGEKKPFGDRACTGAGKLASPP